MLLDTAGLLCLFNAYEIRHVEAVRLYDEATVCVTHNYVIAEFVALSHACRFPRKESLAFTSSLTIDSAINVHWVDLQFHAEAMRMLNTQLDKLYSLCDAISMVFVMRFPPIILLSKQAFTAICPADKLPSQNHPPARDRPNARSDSRYVCGFYNSHYQT